MVIVRLHLTKAANVERCYKYTEMGNFDCSCSRWNIDYISHLNICIMQIEFRFNFRFNYPLSLSNNVQNA